MATVRRDNSSTLPGIDVKVEQEALELMSSQQLFILAGTVVASTFVYLGIRNILATPLLPLWLALVYLSSLARYLGNYYFYNRLSTSKLQIFYVLGSLVSGLLWGALPIIASSSNSLLAMAITSIVVSCMTAAAIAGLSAYPRAYYAYAVPAVLGMASAFPLYNIQGLTILVVLALFYLFVVISFCNNIHRTTINAIRLRLENEALLDEVRKQANIAEKANIDKSRFLAAASHDLRQPFHALSLFVSSIKDNNLDAETRGIVDNIRSSTGALERMFTELLDVSRLDAGAVKPQHVHFSTDDLTASFREEFETIAREKGLEFRCHDVDLVVYSDPLLCERILRNILSNAFNYTHTGQISIEFSQQGDLVNVAVSDTGIGIETDKHERIFSEFEQLQNPERDRNKGLGLGLAIVKRLCSLLDLGITIDSAPGKGSTFTIALPVGERENLTAKATEQIATETPHQLTGKTVLVVDDDAMVLEGMKSQLAKWQCHSLLASTEQEALKLIGEEGLPDVIICDYRLRDEVTGVDVIANLNRSMEKPVPTIIITGDTDPDILKGIMAAGASLVLHKPVQGARLRMALNSLL